MRHAALTEAALDEAVLAVDVPSPEAIAAAVGSVLDSPDVAARLRRLGQEQAMRFSWRTNAAATMDVLARVAGVT